MRPIQRSLFAEEIDASIIKDKTASTFIDNMKLPVRRWFRFQRRFLGGAGGEREAWSVKGGAWRVKTESNGLAQEPPATIAPLRNTIARKAGVHPGGYDRINPDSKSETDSMPTIEISGQNLLDAVKQMAPEEFDAFMERALSVRSRSKPATLSCAKRSSFLESIAVCPKNCQNVMGY